MTLTYIHIADVAYLFVTNLLFVQLFLFNLNIALAILYSNSHANKALREEREGFSDGVRERERRRGRGREGGLSLSCFCFLLDFKIFSFTSNNNKLNNRSWKGYRMIGVKSSLLV